MATVRLMQTIAWLALVVGIVLVLLAVEGSGGTDSGAVLGGSVGVLAVAVVVWAGLLFVASRLRSPK